ncbi:MAG: hypothetical protein V4642_14645 [Bacteroidota bacterium]
MSIQNGRRRRTVDVYFVLYLAALILLLPIAKEEEKPQSGTEFLNYLRELTDFTIQPEKTILTYQIERDSAHISVISLDSTNAIFYSGDVEDVRYEFFIEDETLRQTLRLASDKPAPTTVFKISERPADRAAVFSWRPPKNQQSNRILRVRVVATARPKMNPSTFKNGSELERILQSGTRVDAETEFTINIIATNKDGSPVISAPQMQPPILAQNPVNPIDTASAINGQQPFQTFFVQPAIGTIDAIPFQEWSNSILVQGADPARELLQPVLNIEITPKNSGASVRIDNINGSRIFLKGKMETSGVITVKVTGIRQGDNTSATTEFMVISRQIGEPEFHAVMYPQRSYLFKPNIPLITGNETRAVLKDASGERATSLQGENFTFTPDISDTGKTFTFERYVGNVKTGQAFTMQVMNYPLPEVLEERVVKSGAISIKTRSWGYHNGKENRVNLEIMEGSVKRVTQMYADYAFDQKTLAHIQRFEIQPGDVSILKIRAIDARGKTSALKTIRIVE